MATARTLYVTDIAGVTGTNWWSLLQDGGGAPTAGNTSYGWTVAKTAVTNPYWRARLGAVAVATVASASSQIDTTNPQVGTGTANTTAGDSFRAGPYRGTFANSAWTFTLNMQASVVGAIGRLRMRVYKSSNANGSSPTQLTPTAAASALGHTAGPFTMSTSADVNVGFSWSPGAITLNGEYLFFQVEWQETTAGSSTTSNVLFRVGSTIVTPLFTYTDPYSLPSVQAWWDPQSGVTLTSGQITNWVDRVYSAAATGSGASAPPFDLQGVNDFPGILTSSQAQNWALDSSVTDAGTPFTVISIGKLIPPSGNTCTIVAGSAAGNLHCRVQPDGTMLMLSQNTSTFPSPTGTAPGIDKYGILVFSADGTNYSYRCNGVSQGSGTHSMGILSAGAMRLLRNVGNTTECIVGWQADIIYCNVMLATADVEIAEGYLAWKYNAVQLLPTTHPFKSVPPSGLTPFLVPPRRSIVTNRRM